MNIATILRPRTLAAVAVSLVLAASAYGFAAGNEVPTSAVGDSDAVVSGYKVTNVVYTLDEDTNPSKITEVEFNIAPLNSGPEAAVAKIQLTNDPLDPFYTCNLSVAGTATCAISPALATDLAVNLRLVASSTATQVAP